MGRRSNRKNAQDLPATCVVVPNFELEPSEGEDWEGYPEPVTEPKASKRSTVVFAPPSSPPPRTDSFSGQGSNSAPSSNLPSDATMSITLPRVNDDDDDDTDGECDAVPSPQRGNSDKENTRGASTNSQPSVSESAASAAGLDWAQLGKDEALRLVLPNQDPFASTDPFQDPAATAAARRTAARHSRARGAAPAVPAATLPSPEKQLPGTTSGRSRALKGAIPFQPPHRFTPPGSDGGPDDEQGWPDKLPAPAETRQQHSISLPAEDPFGSPVKPSSSTVGDALFDAFAISSECTA